MCASLAYFSPAVIFEIMENETKRKKKFSENAVPNYEKVCEGLPQRTASKDASPGTSESRKSFTDHYPITRWLLNDLT